MCISSSVVGLLQLHPFFPSSFFLQSGDFWSSCEPLVQLDRKPNTQETRTQPNHLSQNSSSIPPRIHKLYIYNLYIYIYINSAYVSSCLRIQLYTCMPTQEYFKLNLNIRYILHIVYI